MSKKKYYFEEPIARSFIQTMGSKKARRDMSYFLGNLTFFGDRIIKDQFKNLLPILSEKKKAFIITGKVTVKLCEPVEKVLKKAKFEYEIWNDTETDPTLISIKAGVEALKEFDADLIIAVGGGSVIDSAKAIWVLFERPDIDLYNVQPLRTLNLKKLNLLQFQLHPVLVPKGRVRLCLVMILLAHREKYPLYH